MALSVERQRFEDAIAKGRAALARCADPDGSYRVPYIREEAVWPTALALLVQKVFGAPADEIEKTALFNFDVGENGERGDSILESLNDLARLGFSVAHGSVVNVSAITPIDVIAEQIVPVAAGF